MPQIKYFLSVACLAIILAGCKPALTVEIESPVNNAAYFYGSEITFLGYAYDRNYQAPDNESFVWSSDRNGQIGRGSNIKSSTLSVGDHTITLAVPGPQEKTVEAHAHIAVLTTHEVTNATELRMLLNALDYNPVLYGCTPLSISDDIQIIGTVTVTDADGFSNTKYPDSRITLSDSEKTLTLSNIELRFRGWLGMSYPGFVWEYIELMPPSDHPCANEETKCPADMVCYDHTDYCRYCMNIGATACPCSDEAY